MLVRKSHLPSLRRAKAESCYDWQTNFIRMSVEQLKAFLERVKADTSLQEKIKAAPNFDEFLRLLRKQASVSLLMT